ncbi:cytohesin-1-like [Watersipora subatra]|uniref:cytohesin-1-like n=1 Tax=Watersipora subatra TaxID=2589382 RepID=UPI00355B4C1E
MKMDKGFDINDLTDDERMLLDKIRRRKEKLIEEIQLLQSEISGISEEMDGMDVAEDRKESSREKKLVDGKKKFNVNPDEGITYLIDQGLLERNCEEVAKFLYSDGLNKTAIGDYLGEREPFNLDVLNAFVGMQELRGMLIVSALRQFLWSFRLPGEGQKIDRMMEKFAERYCELNPGIFTTTDTCYILSYAIIMLNTTLHNANVKMKTGIDQFVSMNRGINNGGDLPRDLLEEIFDSIKKEPFKIPEDDGNDLNNTFFNPDKEGWLWKQGGRYRNWKRRWFILADKCLYYFEYTTDKEPRGIIPLESLSVRECAEVQSRPHCFELFGLNAEVIKACKTDKKTGKVIEGRHNVYKMSAATGKEMDDWMRSINSYISHNPVYDMVHVKRQKIKHTGY